MQNYKNIWWLVGQMEFDCANKITCFVIITNTDIYVFEKKCGAVNLHLRRIYRGYCAQLCRSVAQ